MNLNVLKEAFFVGIAFVLITSVTSVIMGKMVGRSSPLDCEECNKNQLMKVKLQYQSHILALF